jgi:hypothetical protein
MVLHIGVKMIVLRAISVLKANRIKEVLVAQFKMKQISFITSHVQQDPIAGIGQQHYKHLKVYGQLREHMMSIFLSVLQTLPAIVLIVITALPDQLVHTKRNVQRVKLGNHSWLGTEVTHVGLVIQAVIAAKAI